MSRRDERYGASWHSVPQLSRLRIPGVAMTADTANTVEAPPDDAAAPEREEEVTVSEVLVEEVSIDGMCGVY